MAEKERTSGEVPREQDAPVLPTVNPDAQKSESSKVVIPSAVYVAYVPDWPVASPRGRNSLANAPLRRAVSGSA